ncbi:DNA repair protein [Rugosibacter aromaticivorans]|uniref:DNA repair protein RecN n=1 Tax=Rugosibacter aromaticivorans TaxID=1565605 RepID=A0A0C5JMP0_9PROT|nr:DNA repair protein RecN [Rugosibacter aromaticivorans]AJP48616.1 DNA repair protein [Rugosibacter aromaticivorans]TBR15843.1 MAG: DNA repair protein RecN [Rugosibacter sp.]
MLQRLIIRDFVIVDQLELEFGHGFGALTGETGAGKSILIDALSLVLGERADASVIRAGTERAEITAEFDVAADSALASWLQTNDFDVTTCLLRRIVDQSGRSRAYINGTAATLGQLREIATFLADIHGQNAHHSLLNTEAQRALLDAHASAQELLRDVATAYSTWRQAREARQVAMTDSEAAARERELLEWQVKELAALAFNAEEWQETETEQRRLGNASALLEAATGALAALDEGETAALSTLQHAGARLNELITVDPALIDAAKLFDSAVIQLEESALALRRYQDRLELDPSRLVELDSRIDTVTQMARKYRVPPLELPALLARLTAQLDELSLRADPVALAEREQATEAAYLAVAEKLSALRTKTAKRLSAAVTAGMQELAMSGGQFDIALEALGEGASFGLESVEFQVAANAGQSLRPLTKVASGGELSRIGLALQVIASQANPVGTLIFDEVDVGIGGRVAEIVGRMLRDLGKTRQVLCVTHLPQVAAQADWQWTIIKETRNGTVVSSVRRLDKESRVAEIARMLGGEKITSTTQRHAAEMLGLTE